MKKIIALILSTLFCMPSFACSIFMQPQTGMVAKNYDWSLADGELMIRPQGAKKKSLHSQKAWTSLYGSVTFNQYGPDLPTGGINEHGLIIEALVLGSTQHKKITDEEKLQQINEAEFMQYQLDMHNSVDEVIASLDQLYVTKIHVPIHYFTCDQTKKCAVIEFIQGQTIVYSDDNLELPVLTNLEYKSLLNGYKAQLSSAAGFASHVRFKRLAEFELQGLSQNDMFEKLNAAKIANYTVWQIVYSPQHRTVAFQSKFSSESLSIDLKNINFTCHKEIQALSIHKKEINFNNNSIAAQLGQRVKALENVPTDIKLKLLSRPLLNNCN